MILIRRVNDIYFHYCPVKSYQLNDAIDNIASLTGLILLGLLFILPILSPYRTVPLGTKYW